MMVSSYCESHVLKGYLYKIKNDRKETIGYLFGTIHQIEKEKQSLLHPKIFKYLSRSQALWLEIKPFDEQRLIDHLKANGTSSEKKMIEQMQKTQGGSKQQAIEKIAKMSVKWLKENPESVEAILALKAENDGLEVRNLETEESRKEAFEAVRKDVQKADLERKYFAAVFTCTSSEILQKAIQMIKDNNDVGDTLNDLFKGYRTLLRAIMHIDFQQAEGLGTEYYTLSQQVADLIGQYEIIFKAFKLDLQPINALKQFHLAQKNKLYLGKKKLVAAWGVGRANILEEFKAGFTPVEAKLHELMDKMSMIRDKWMVKQIHPLLQQSSLEKRYFFAVGCVHLIGGYKNVKQRLEQKGWKIVNAYDE